MVNYAVSFEVLFFFFFFVVFFFFLCVCVCVNFVVTHLIKLPFTESEVLDLDYKIQALDLTFI